MCPHPLGRKGPTSSVGGWEQITTGIYRCRTCGARVHPNRRTSLPLTPSYTLAAGDPCRVDDLGSATFLYTDEDRGGPYVVVRRHHYGGTAAVTPDRVRQARRPRTR